ncbi:hypothetical protein EB796_007611 [Bugula neritina]|uniref:Uncharacterized protein n=1 Tax=Bugula neritina TaxID=10212 RepID=A0A7J7K8Y8_BUGNE|nr:hypothetical protein EB796_007611 [Bugula neritina]
MEHIINSGLCEYIRPPIDKYQTLQFNAFEEIFDAGYNFAKPYFAAMIQTEKIRAVLRPTDKRLMNRLMPESSSLTDLANIISEPADEPDESISVFDITKALGTFNDEETEDGEDDFESHDSEPEHEFSISDDE